jgi:hypothetical protein
MRCTHKVEVILLFASCYNLSHTFGSSSLPMASCRRRMPLEATALWKPLAPPRCLLQAAAGLCKLPTRSGTPAPRQRPPAGSGMLTCLQCPPTHRIYNVGPSATPTCLRYQPLRGTCSPQQQVPPRCPLAAVAGPYAMSPCHHSQPLRDAPLPLDATASTV